MNAFTRTLLTCALMALTTAGCLAVEDDPLVWETHSALGGGRGGDGGASKDDGDAGGGGSNDGGGGGSSDGGGAGDGGTSSDAGAMSCMDAVSEAATLMIDGDWTDDDLTPLYAACGAPADEKCVPDVYFDHQACVDGRDNNCAAFLRADILACVQS